MKWFLQGQTFCLRIRSFLYNQKQPKPPNSISRNGYFVQTSLKLDRKMKQTDQIDFGLSSDDHQVWFVRNKPSIWRIKCDKYSGSTCWWLLFKCFSLVSASLLLLSWCFTFRYRQIITIVCWLHTWTSPINFLNHIPFFHRENRPPCWYHLFIQTWAEQTVWFTAWEASNTSSVTFIRSYIRIQPSPSASLPV